MSQVKLTFNGEIRRFIVESYFSLTELKDKAYGLFHPALDGVAINFKWKDDEDDWVTLKSDAELTAAIVFFQEQGKPFLKFEVVAVENFRPPAQSSPKPSVHNGVCCDGCGISPIVGTRYKCAIRHDFDLCEKCESSSPQPHAMIKIYSPEQAPAAIFIAARDNIGDSSHPGRHHHSHPPKPPHGHHGHHGHHHGPCGRQGPHARHGRHCGPNQDRDRGNRRCPLRGFSLDVEGLFTKAMDGLFGEDLKHQPNGSCPASEGSQASQPPVAAQGHHSGNDNAAAASLEEFEQQQLDEAIRASLEISSGSHPVCESDNEEEVEMAYEVHPSSTVVADKHPNNAVSPAAVEVAVHATAPVVAHARPIGRLSSCFITRPDQAVVEEGHWMHSLLLLNNGTLAWPLLSKLEADFSSAADLINGDDASFGQYPAVKVTVPATVQSVASDALVKVDVAVAVPPSARFLRLMMTTADGARFGDPLIVGIASSSPLVSDPTTSEQDVVSDWQVISPNPSSASPTESGVLTSESVSTDPQPTNSSGIDAGRANDIMSAVVQVWSAELDILAQMGFTDAHGLIPILKRYIDVPASMMPKDATGRSPAPDARGIQDTILHILNDREVLVRGLDNARP